MRVQVLPPVQVSQAGVPMYLGGAASDDRLQDLALVHGPDLLRNVARGKQSWGNLKYGG
jgi:hypothetical protein